MVTPMLMVYGIPVAMNDWPEIQPLETAKLFLEPLTVAHAREMTNVLADTRLYRYIGGKPPTLQQLHEQYARQVVGHSADGGQGWLNWIVSQRDSANAIGFVQATLIRSGISLTADVAWMVAPQYQGNGFATQAATRMVDWLYEHKITRINAYINPMNIASTRVAHHLEMHATGAVFDGEVRWETSLPE